MARNKYCNELKSRIVNDYLAGIKQKDISVKYVIHKSVISRIIQRYKERNTVATVHSGGRPRKTTVAEDRLITRNFKKNPLISPREVANNLGLDISARTASRRATEAGLGCYRGAKKPFISKKNKFKRIKFAKDHLNWSSQQWKAVLFSDESKFNIKGTDGITFVRRPKGKRFVPRYCISTVKHGGGSIMVWGCFSGHGMGPVFQIIDILTGQGYKNILQEVMLPYADENMPLRWTFQHDNDPKHTSKVVKSYLKSKKVSVLDWPAQSPDLNPIENLWEIVDRRIRKTNYSTKESLYAAIQQAKNSFLNSNLISSRMKI